MIASQTLSLTLFQYLLKLTDIFEQIFDFFAGTAQIRPDARTGYFYNVMIGQSGVSRAFWVITLVAFFMCAAFSAATVLRSSLDIKGKRAVKRVLRVTGKAMLTFLLVPFIIIASLNLLSIMLKGAGESIEVRTGRDGATLGTHLFLAVAADNYKEGVYTEAVSKQFLTKEKDYMNTGNVTAVVDPAAMKYEIGIAAALVICALMLITCFMFVRRIFEMMALYVAAPYFVSAIPLDRGARFKRWQELFIAKAVSAFSAVYLVKLYTMLLPLLMSESVKYLDDPVSNLIIKLIFVCVTGYAVVKASASIMRALNPRTETGSKSLIPEFMRFRTEGGVLSLVPENAIEEKPEPAKDAQKALEQTSQPKKRTRPENLNAPPPTSFAIYPSSVKVKPAQDETRTMVMSSVGAGSAAASGDPAKAGRSDGFALAPD